MKIAVGIAHGRSPHAEEFRRVATVERSASASKISNVATRRAVTAIHTVGCRPLSSGRSATKCHSPPHSQAITKTDSLLPLSFSEMARVHKKTRRLDSAPGRKMEEEDYYFAFSAASMAAMTSGASGLVLGLKRWSTVPSLPTRNLPKFHSMSPGNFASGPVSAA